MFSLLVPPSKHGYSIVEEQGMNRATVMSHVLMQNTEQKLGDLVHFYQPATTYVNAIYRFIVFFSCGWHYNIG